MSRIHLNSCGMQKLAVNLEFHAFTAICDGLTMTIAFRIAQQNLYLYNFSK